MLINKQFLKNIGACQQGKDDFNKLFPNGAKINSWPKEMQTWVLKSPLRKYWGYAVKMGIIPAWSMSCWKMNGMDLAEADLRFADFFGAELTNVDFTKAFIPGASFWSANLAGSKFVHAYLWQSNFHQANLENVDFTKAMIHGCDFTTALNVEKANFTNVKIDKTTRGLP